MVRARRDATMSFLEPRRGARSRRLAFAFGARSVLAAAVRTVQTAENLRRDPLFRVHRTKRASHDVVTPLFPLLKVLRRLTNARHALGLGGSEARARDELSRAKECAQTHGATDGGEDGVHLDVCARVVVRQSIGRRGGMRVRIRRCARSLARSIDSLGYPFAVASSSSSSSRRVASSWGAPLVSTNAGRTSRRSCRRRRRRPSGVRRLAFAGGRSRRSRAGRRARGFSHRPFVIR